MRPKRRHPQGNFHDPPRGARPPRTRVIISNSFRPDFRPPPTPTPRRGGTPQFMSPKRCRGGFRFCRNCWGKKGPLSQNPERSHRGRPARRPSPGRAPLPPTPACRPTKCIRLSSSLPLGNPLPWGHRDGEGDGGVTWDPTSRVEGTGSQRDESDLRYGPTPDVQSPRCIGSQSLPSP